MVPELTSGSAGGTDYSHQRVPREPVYSHQLKNELLHQIDDNLLAFRGLRSMCCPAAVPLRRYQRSTTARCDALRRRPLLGVTRGLVAVCFDSDVSDGKAHYRSTAVTQYTTCSTHSYTVHDPFHQQPRTKGKPTYEARPNEVAQQLLVGQGVNAVDSENFFPLALRSPNGPATPRSAKGVKAHYGSTAVTQYTTRSTHSYIHITRPVPPTAPNERQAYLRGKTQRSGPATSRWARCECR
jgi:hypothetical protein